MKSTVPLIPLIVLIVAAGASRAEPPSVPHSGSLSGPATAPAPPRRGPQVVRMTVHPRAVESPALHYALLPGPAEQTHGNAAQLYLLAFNYAVARPADAEKLPPGTSATLPGDDEASDLCDLYEHLPLSDLPQKEVEAYVRGFAPLLDFLDLAARRDHCDWDLPLREQGFAALLPHLNHARNAANHLAVRARLQIARHDWEKAADSLRTGMALGRGLNEQAVLIQALVALGIDAVWLARVEEWAQQPGAPNLYWDLADLPHPLVDMPQSLRWERAMVMATFPQLKKAKDGTFTADDWRELINSIGQKLGGPGGLVGGGVDSTLGAAAAGTLFYPRAKQYLVERGMTPGQVEAMPVPLVLGRYVLESYEQWTDEMMKWAGLPWWQAEPGIRRAQEAFLRNADEKMSNFLLMAVPAISRALFAGVRVDRQVAALQTVEALRDYAARHDGLPPASLAELTETPAPLDPVTGKPFAYEVAGNRVTLSSSAPTQDPHDSVRYEVTFVR